MKRLFLCAVLALFGVAPAMFGDVIDYMLNINGVGYCPPGSGVTLVTPCNTGGLAVAPGVTGTLDTAFNGTGLGTVSLTFNPGIPGTYNVGFWLFEELFPASGNNEYGIANGSPVVGQSWQIDTPDANYVASSDPNFGGLPAGAASIVANTAAFTLSNTNYIPGNLSQYNYDCVLSPFCNDYTSMAQAFNFTLGPGQQELLNFTVSTTKPANGFYLQQVAPVDGSNSSEIDYYFTASATTVPVCSGPDCSAVPEPSSMVPLFGFAGVLWLMVRRRAARA